MRTNVAVIRGGPSNEFQYSIKNGEEIMRQLSEQKYVVHDVFVDKDGTWHRRGIPMNPVQALWGSDVAINAIHGGIGEDGTVSRLVKQQGIPLVGSDPLALSQAYNKATTRETLRAYGIVVPQGMTFSAESALDPRAMSKQVFAQFGPPYIVKPLFESRSRGVHYASSIRELPYALADVLDVFGAALVESYVRGEHIRASVMRNFRDQAIYVFPIAHTRLPEGAKFIEPIHYETNALVHDTPTRFSYNDKRDLESLARSVHEALELGPLSHVDMIRTPRRTYVLEVDTAPELLPGSPAVNMMQAVGVTPSQYLDHMIEHALA